jgi:hypothetical protein
VVEAQVSKADYVLQLQAFYAQHGRAPTAGECGAGHSPKRNPLVPSYNTLCWHFGTFRKALEAAGVPYRLHGVRLNTTARNPHNIRAGLPVDSATNRIDCPVDRMHRPRMIPDTTQYGFPMGRLIAWCYECKREIPNEPVAVAVSARERAGDGPGQRFDYAPHDSPTTRKRNATIRLAWHNGEATQLELARRYGMSQERIATILGRKRSA